MDLYTQLAEMVVRHVEKDIVLQLKQHDNKVRLSAFLNQAQGPLYEPRYRRHASLLP